MGQDIRFSKGLPADPNTFPIAVWLQAPSNAGRYAAIGINTYVGLWRGPSEEQLDQLDKAKIKLICGQNRRALQFKDRATIVGWMHGDEPDNAQALPGGKGYGPPILPQTIIEGYERIRKADPDRPVLLNLGQGVAWDGYYGRGVRTNHPEDYKDYIKGSDIVSFDIYPASHDKKEIAGNLWYVPKGVDRLRKWSDDKKAVWCCIETTRINNPATKPTPAQMRSEVWMALIHGAKGIIYFAHEFKPKFIEAGLLADKEIAEAVGAVNKQILEFAPVINSPDVKDAASVRSWNHDVPVDIVVKRHQDTTYLFAVAMRNQSIRANFTLHEQQDAKIEVIGEDRSITCKAGHWDDLFEGYQVHLYRIVLNTLSR
jgi:hypothetical protein